MAIQNPWCDVHIPSLAEFVDADNKVEIFNVRCNMHKFLGNSFEKINGWINCKCFDGMEDLKNQMI